jgi:hypothetical protein
MKICPAAQGSAQWFDDRRGRPTASLFSKILTSKGLELSKQSDSYARKLAGERVFNVIEEGFSNKWTDRGIELEDTARSLYELINGVQVDECGLCLSDDMRFGASPDGLVNDDGLIEIKCPNLETHIGYLLGNVLPDGYRLQVQGELFVTGREWADFVSYYPDCPSLIVRVLPDLAVFNALTEELPKFCDKIDHYCLQLEKLGA